MSKPLVGAEPDLMEALDMLQEIATATAKQQEAPARLSRLAHIRLALKKAGVK